MADNAKVKANIDELNKLTRFLKEEYKVRVGILGSKAAAQHDNKSGLTNVEIGTFHEFGTENMPQRSFLMMPLQEKLSAEIPKMKKYIFKQFFVKKAPKQFYMDLGSKALDIIESAFNTNGFGQWKALTSSSRSAWERRAGIAGWRTARSIASFRKGLNKSLSRQILTDTRKLRRSISFKIIKGN